MGFPTQILAFVVIEFSYLLFMPLSTGGLKVRLFDRHKERLARVGRPVPRNRRSLTRPGATPFLTRIGVKLVRL